MTNFSDNDKKEILNLKVTQMKDLLSSGKISNEELVNIHIDQVEKYDTKTNAICTFTPEQAVSEARKLDSKKKFDKPLSGIPIFIKDLTKTKGIRTTMGSRIYENDIPEEDMETALKALAAHTSQVPPEAIERVRAWKSENGKKHNMKYAESFRTFTLR